MTQSFFQPQYQGAVQAQGFQQRQVPDISGLLRQQQQTEQQNYQNLAEAYNRMPKQEGLTALADFSDTLSKALVTFAQARNEKQKAEGISQFYEDQAAQQQALEEHERQLAPVREFDYASKAAASDAMDQGVPFEVADKLKQLSGWKKYGYAQAAAMAAGDGYKSWMLTQLQSNEGLVTLNAGTPEERTVKINSQELTVAESAAVRAELRTRYLQQSGLANLSAGLQAQAFKPMHQADSEMNGLARLNYSIRKSQEDEQILVRDFINNKDLGSLITGLTSLVDQNGKAYGNKGAIARTRQLIADMAAQGEDVDFKQLRNQPVPWDKKGRTFGELYGKAGQWLSGLETEVARAKIARASLENQQWEVKRHNTVKGLVDDYRSRPSFTKADIEEGQRFLVSQGYGRSSELDALGATISEDALYVSERQKEAERKRITGTLTPEYVNTLPPELFNTYAPVAAAQAKATQTPAAKASMDSLENHIKTFTKVGPLKDLEGIPTLIVADLQREYLQELAKASVMPDFEANQVQYERAAIKTVLDNFAVNSKAGSGHAHEYVKGGFPNYFKSASVTAGQTREWMKSRYQKIQDKNGLMNALKDPEFGLMSKERYAQISQSYGTPGFHFPPEVTHFSNKYNIPPITIMNEWADTLGETKLSEPAAMERFRANTEANKHLFNRYSTEFRTARALGTPETWRSQTSMRGQFAAPKPTTPTVYGSRSDYRGSSTVVTVETKDQQGRPLRFAPKAADAWKQMLAAGMPVNPKDITSVYRDENDYLRLKSEGYNPASNSYHNYGEAIDVHGKTGEWIRKYGHKFGWFPHDYNGSHGGHYEYRGVK